MIWFLPRRRTPPSDNPVRDLAYEIEQTTIRYAGGHAAATDALRRLEETTRDGS